MPTPMPMPSMTAPGGTYPGGGPGGPRSTTTSSGGGLRLGGDFSTRLGGGDISTFFISTFLLSGGVGGVVHGQVGPSATLVGCTTGAVSAALAPSERLRTRACIVCAV